jgi:hypothetical protein
VSFHVPEDRRLVTGTLASRPEDGNNGAFLLRLRYSRRALAIASDGLGWEHVSVSFVTDTPTWDQMCEVKAVFWDPEDCVVQYHPPTSEYVNLHPHCLHLWRPVGSEIQRPDPMLVGPRIEGWTRQETLA